MTRRPLRPVLLGAVLFLVACGTAAKSEQGDGPRAAGPPAPVIDLDAVPRVDVSKHSVPLGDVVFDTFNGSFLRLGEASPSQIRALRDAIKPIYRPRYGGQDSLPWLRDGDLVIGYATRRGAYAFPLKILNFRELVNDVIDGQPILISYCPLCGSGVVYSRRLEGRTLLFGNTSALYQSDLVMFDHQTGSYWFQVQGEALVGKLTGKRLPPLPATTLPWGEWKQLHPETRLLAADGSTAFGSQYASDPFAGYAQQVDRGGFAFPVSKNKLDSRLRASEVVIAVEVGSHAKAYPLQRIGDGAVNDAVGSVPVVLFSRGGTGSIFRASVSGRRLFFDLPGGAFVDRQTRSTWNQAGRAVAGPLKGSSLQPLPSRRAFWFSIAIASPGIDLYMPEPGLGENADR